MGIRRRSVIGLLVAVLATLTVLTGCTDDRERPSSTLPPLNSSSSATPTPTDAPGAEGYPLPEEARAYTPEAARLYIDYFLGVLNDPQPDGNVDALREITLPACEICGEIIARREQNARDGIQVVGGEFVIVSEAAVRLTDEPGVGPSALMNVQGRQEPLQALNSNGEYIGQTPALEIVGGFQLQWAAEDREWFVYGFPNSVQG